MRLKIVFESGIFDSTQKLWVEVPYIETVESFKAYLKSEFGINEDIDLYLDGFYLHSKLNLINLTNDSETLQVKSSGEPDLYKITKQEPKHEKRIDMYINEFQGRKMKFNEKGKVIENVPVEQTLRILSPAEEFAVKKSEWKIKAIPKRRPLRQDLCPKLISTQEVVQYDELEIGWKIKFTLRNDPIVKVLYI